MRRRGRNKNTLKGKDRKNSRKRIENDNYKSRSSVRRKKRSKLRKKR